MPIDRPRAAARGADPMPEKDHARLVDELEASFRTQIAWYEKLKAIVEKILSQVILSRGDMSAVKNLLTQKRDCLEAITRERERVRESTREWIALKASIPHTAAVMRLETVLADTERVIREFLETESQLQKCLEHMMRKSPAV
jgi:hypothetical protein